MNPLIHKAVEAEKGMEENFWSDGKFYMVRCPKCNKENYAPAVSTGQCAWCGYVLNRLADKIIDEWRGQL